MWAVHELDRLLEEIEDSFVNNIFLRAIVILVALAMLAIALTACAPPASAPVAPLAEEAPVLTPGVPDGANHFRREYVRIIRSEWGLEAPVATFAAQIHQESAWNCRAISHAGARGCAQFMPATADWIGDVDAGLRGGDVFSPAWAFRAQAVYMKWLHARIKASDGCNRMAFALAAYNGGLGRVYQRQKLSREPGVCLRATCDINPGISAANQRENAGYPSRILLVLEPRYATWGPRSC